MLLKPKEPTQGGATFLASQAKNRRVHERLLILSHLKEGKRSQEEEQALSVGVPTVKRYKQNFINQGLVGLEDKPRSGGRPTRFR